MQNVPWFHGSPEPCCEEKTTIHESTYIDQPVQIGHGTTILHHSHVMANAMIGSHCHIGHNVAISSGVMISDNVRISNNSQLSSGVIIENDVYCGPSMVITLLKYIRGNAQNISHIQPTLIKRGATVGANTTIASGFSIGAYSFIESGAVVDSHVPDFALMYGNPIQFAGWRCECGQVLKFTIADTTTCSRCGHKYAQKSQTEVVSLQNRVEVPQFKFTK